MTKQLSMKTVKESVSSSRNYQEDGNIQGTSQSLYVISCLPEDPHVTKLGSTCIKPHLQRRVRIIIFPLHDEPSVWNK